MSQRLGVDGNTASQIIEAVHQSEPSSPQEVLDSLAEQFTYLQESSDRKGLRLPQIGALHAISSTWTLNAKEPITIVMPTGTGKTETMISAFAAHRIERLIIVVPSDALRTQIADKMQSYGVLQEFGVIGSNALKPVVGRVSHGFKTIEGAERFADMCNIVVTTSSALNQSAEPVRKTFLSKFSVLFVDEAHHIAANTWLQIRAEFLGKRVVQFTATPFREDSKRLGGKIAYSYPLKEAQSNGYFSKINYVSVVNFDDIDEAIAQEAVDRLNADLENSLDHLMIARVHTKRRAGELLATYQRLAPQHQPVKLVSGMPIAEKRSALTRLRNHESRIVVCVDMLGEGFDLPSLKIAAIHDQHKTLGITLQFVGRIARVGNSSLGEATAVVGRGERRIDARLRDLYAENSDWNHVIQNLSADAIEEQQELTEFESGFTNLPDDVSIINLAPKMSTVVYKTQRSVWHPERIEDLYAKRLLEAPAINHEEHVVWFVTKDVEEVRWGDVRSIAQTNYNLFVAFWDSEKNLLYINASNNEGVFAELAHALCGESAELFRGKAVYKTMASLNRRIATNVGLLDPRNQDSRFEMRVGPNVINALGEEARRSKAQTNIFAHGIDSKSGIKQSVGASLKGRVWSYKSATGLKQWMDWCKEVGAKLEDPDIDPSDVMDGFLVPQAMETRPSYVPLALEWPTDMYLDVSEVLRVQIGKAVAPFIDCGLEITDYSNTGPIPFKIVLPDGSSVECKVTLAGGKMTFDVVGQEAHVLTARTSTMLKDYLDRFGLRIIMEKEAVIEPEMVMIAPKSVAPAYRKEKLQTLDWATDGINIRKESQGISRDQTSIQARAIKYLQETGTWDIIMDDDGANEIADIVAIRVEGRELHVSLVHCKFSHEDTPGHRVIDLYEVCGQAQKSIARRRDPELLLENLIRREKNRRKKSITGLITGTDQKIQDIADNSRLLSPRFEITIVQPGVSKATVSREQLELIAATERYIQDAGGNTPLRVICSQ